MDFKAFLNLFEPYLFPVHSIQNSKCTCENESCGHAGKHPLIKFNWKTIATKEVSKIKRWSKKYPNANWAVATGRKFKNTGKYLVVLDIDQTSKFMDILPATFHYKTGGGGYHFWFLCNKEIPCKVSILGEKIDIRGKNGYVLVPPSKHKSGKNYSFIPDSPTELADIPDFILNGLHKELTAPKPTPRKPAVPRKQNPWFDLSVEQIKEKILNEEKVPVGARNVTLYRLLCSERAKGADRKKLLEHSDLFNGFLEQGLPEEEVRKITDSAAKKPIYNNNPAEINQVFCSWLKKQGISCPLTAEELDKLDENFFSELKKTHTFETSLAKIKDEREQFYLKRNIGFGPAKIKPSMLAKILLEKGFEKRHASVGNLWNIGV